MLANDWLEFESLNLVSDRKRRGCEIVFDRCARYGSFRATRGFGETVILPSAQYAEPPGSKAKSAHDMGREFHVLSRLHGPYPLAPEAVHFCEDGSIMGGKFCVMQRLTGVIVRHDYPEEGGVTPEQIRAQFTGLIDALATLHSLNVSDVGLADFGKPQGYRKRQLDGWLKRLSDAKTENMADFQEVTSWLAAQIPTAPEEAAVVHNDLKMHNLVWDPVDITLLIGVLDWEMATVGDPLMDLACTLSFWAEEGDRAEFRSMRGMPSRGPEDWRRGGGARLFS